MVQCPSCNTEIDADFGMINCPKCDAVFMVDFDGNVQEGAEQNDNEIDVLGASDLDNAQDIDEPIGEDSWQELPDGNETEEIEEDYQSLDDPPEDVEDFQAMSIGTPENPSGEESYEEVSTHETDESESAEELEHAEDDYDESFLDSHIDGEESQVEAQAEDPNDPLGVTKFDQSDVSQLPEGAYYYDVHITGLDTADIKREALMVLSDRRFGWNPEDIKRSIKNGELVLKNLNPVKAVIAVMNLQSLDVDISWTQKLFTDESLLEKDQMPEEEDFDADKTNPSIATDPEGEVEA